MTGKDYGKNESKGFKPKPTIGKYYRTNESKERIETNIDDRKIL